MGSRNLLPVTVAEDKSGRYISLSVLIHAALVAGVTLMGLPPSQLSPQNVVEFEVESQVTGTTAIPEGMPVPVSLGAAAPKTAPAAPSEPSLDDIPTPALEATPVEKVAVAPLEEKDLQEDFEKIDKAHSEALAQAKEAFERDLEATATLNDNALAEVEADAEAEAEAKAEAKAKAEAEAAAIAAAAAEQEEASRQAQERAQAEAAQNEGTGTGHEGQGTGNSGSPEPTLQVAGIPGGVRALEQLRQMPGNKFPQYSREERLARQEGKAMFYAYVTTDGSLSQFKLGQSTGYRNLDLKTLAALKKWKFYPGQEGWVELPFQWVLKGDALEAGGQLRK